MEIETPQDVRTVRHILGLTQLELAYALGCTARSIRRYESGEIFSKQNQLALKYLLVEYFEKNISEI